MEQKEEKEVGEHLTEVTDKTERKLENKLAKEAGQRKRKQRSKN